MNAWLINNSLSFEIKGFNIRKNSRNTMMIDQFPYAIRVIDILLPVMKKFYINSGMTIDWLWPWLTENRCHSQVKNEVYQIVLQLSYVRWKKSTVFSINILRMILISEAIYWHIIFVSFICGFYWMCNSIDKSASHCLC